uniref:Uncharacterized protein n=1 Tax=Magallana gigas TaxID=29159 RepID=A0A8W8MRB2_MAGGI
MSQAQGEKIMLMLADILKEQKALKEEVKKLTGQGQQKNVSKNISIEGSPIEVESDDDSIYLTAEYPVQNEDTSEDGSIPTLTGDDQESAECLEEGSREDAPNQNTEASDDPDTSSSSSSSNSSISGVIDDTQDEIHEDDDTDDDDQNIPRRSTRVRQKPKWMENFVCNSELREYVIWLKEKFSVNPWISFQEPEVQEKLGELARKAGWPGQAMGVMSSFGSTKFTYYRNQIRSKLMGNKEVDVEGLSIKSLHNYLWKCFLPASTSLANPNREHLTLMLVCEQLYNLHYKC